MRINGSPTSLDIFGISAASPGSSPTESQDLFASTSTDFSSPLINQNAYQRPLTPTTKRPCFRTPQPNIQSSNSSKTEEVKPLYSKGNATSVSSLSATVNKSVQGIYSSQEVKLFQLSQL